MENQITLGGMTLIGERMGSHIHVTVLGIGPRGHRPLCGTIRVVESEWLAMQHAAEQLETLRSVLGSWCFAELVEDAHCTDYQGALLAVARLETQAKEQTEQKFQTKRGEPGRQAGQG